MAGLLEGKKGIIFGALDERSLAWHVATHCQQEGAQIVLTNTETAIQLGTVAELAAVHNMPLIVCDATKTEDIEALFTRARALTGGDKILFCTPWRKARTCDGIKHTKRLTTPIFSKRWIYLPSVCISY